jgi:hypothetical protein
MRLFFVFFERERKYETGFLSFDDAVEDSTEADEQRFMEESLPRAENEKGLPLRAKPDAKSGFYVVGGSPTSGLGSPLVSMVARSSSPPPGGSPTSGLGSQLMVMGTTSSLPLLGSSPNSGLKSSLITMEATTLRRRRGARSPPGLARR